MQLREQQGEAIDVRLLPIGLEGIRALGAQRGPFVDESRLVASISSLKMKQKAVNGILEYGAVDVVWGDQIEVGQHEVALRGQRAAASNRLSRALLRDPLYGALVEVEREGGSTGASVEVQVGHVSNSRGVRRTNMHGGQKHGKSIEVMGVPRAYRTSAEPTGAGPMEVPRRPTRPLPGRGTR